MTVKEVLQIIDKLISRLEESMRLNPLDYYEGALDALEELRDAIKEGGEE